MAAFFGATPGTRRPALVRTARRDGEARAALWAAPATVETDWHRYRLTLRARRDLTAIRPHIAEVSPERRVVAVIERIRDRCRSLESAPAQGRIRDEAPIGGKVFSLPAWPYVIFYRIAEANVVQVLRVIDGRRDLGTAFFAE